MTLGDMVSIGVIVGLVALAPLFVSLLTSREQHHQEERAHEQELPPT